jgi:hypothetical protein
MRSLAKDLRFQGARLRNTPNMIVKKFNGLPMQAPFFSSASIRMLDVQVLGSVCGAKLEAVAARLMTAADDVEQRQKQWRALKARLDAEARERNRPR